MKLTAGSWQLRAFFDAASVSMNSCSSCRCARPGVPGAKLEKYENGWWWYWKTLSGHFGYVNVGSWFGSEHVGPLPFVQPGLPTSPTAFDQPPPYQPQLTFFADSRSPIVACDWATSFSPNVPDGSKAGCIVLTAQLPHARFATGDGHVTVKSLSR